MGDHIIFPVNPHKAVVYRGPAFYLAGGAQMLTLPPEHFGIIQSDAPPHIAQQIRSGAKCFKIKLKDALSSTGKMDTGATTFAHIQAAIVEYLLNGERTSAPLWFRHGFAFKAGRRLRLHSTIELERPDVHDPRGSFKLKALNQESTAAFYEMIVTAIARDPGLLLPLERFNAALLRRSALDKIVDLAIALEALIGSQAELSFKFSLFHSLAISKDPSARKEANERLRKLYDARSKIAHGSVSKNVKYVQDNFSDFESLCRKAVTYAIFWVASGNSLDNYTEHLLDLALGKDVYEVFNGGGQ